ncbi:PREDICTED: uncharacterized protein LOC109220143 [Nicotiana attenuata]|uniref:uncharacterized protein LOC109220143 n=1 Tax=Nicotiana attenuata TaxID=49451 RepID=UPI000904E86F|nr:PREDICTED: uncharacterized protein LOC109220143 [Nicotiana attenuata]
MKTRGALKKKANIALISQIEPKKIEEALKDSSWMQEMQEELDQIDKNQVWKLIAKRENVPVIGTKWVFRNKLNEDGKVVRNKARLVDQEFTTRNADLEGDNEERKSTSGTCQLLGKALISWNSKKQGSVALSTTEVEYIAVGQCCAQLL